MAPKARAAKAADKAKLASKQKVAEDKTFGLKNKNKSAKVQQYVQHVKKTVDDAAKKQKSAATEQKDKKKAELDRQKELAELFAVAIKQPKVPVGTDPKSVLCEYFRHGQCTKGFKCKFSHDLSVERKGGKIDVFSDRRKDGEEDEEGMDDWDQDKLEEVIAQKHGVEKNRPTDIICKFFLDAVEKKMYGWFWQCPNGKECKYRHALPPGYVLKSQMKELLEAEAANVKPIEDEIEDERRKVEAKTPITEETFRRWREDRKTDKEKKEAQAEADRKRKGILTGREIFMEEGFMAQDDAGAQEAYERELDEEEDIRRMDAEAAARRAQGASHASAATAGPSSGAAPAQNSAGASSAQNGISSVAQAAAQEDGLFDEELSSDEEEEEEDVDDSELDSLEASLAEANVK
ncbi:g5480 [Coccomyxa viridis]|uniref:G5480 protein n=1 Tax=Coccomyxa viridis TaxID=1274662 RepID=A0ABP1FSY1_9CHLO